MAFLGSKEKVEYENLNSVGKNTLSLQSKPCASNFVLWLSNSRLDNLCNQKVH